MCGLIGVWSPKAPLPTTLFQDMTMALKHRGPDMGDVYAETVAAPAGQIALGHRRLSILDLSDQGKQPYHSVDGMLSLVYNGEIYNHMELRAELDAGSLDHTWQSASDTETLMVCLQHYGVQPTLERLNGMFAFALWDAQEGTITLARDRFGEKPLYYGFVGDRFVFASELSPLTALPDWQPTIDRTALSLFLSYSYVPSPFCIYEGLHKLEAAHSCTFSTQTGKVSAPQQYWSLQLCSKAPRLTGSDTEIMTQLESLLDDAVQSRCLSDVPLGCFLSGGVDSSLVASLMQARSDKPVKTFSIGFDDPQFNEAIHAKAIADHLGTDHHELYVSAEQARALVPELGKIWDEPFADSSQIPTYMVNKMAREHVKVCLSGDGGDELFSGYNRYTTGLAVWQKSQKLPKPVRRSLAWLAKKAPAAALDSVQEKLPVRFRVSRLADRLPKLANVLALDSVRAYYNNLTTQLHDPQALLRDKGPVGTVDRVQNVFDTETLDPRRRMMLADQLGYLTDDILTKVDRASMAVSLEARVPLLDHRLVEYAWQLPDHMLVRDGSSKWALREVLYKHVPREMIERPKIGFGIPIETWLRGPLRDWAEDLLSNDKLERHDLFEASAVENLWKSFLAGQPGLAFQLWPLLMFQSWYDVTDYTARPETSAKAS